MCAVWGSTFSTQLNSPETCPAGCVSHAHTHIYTLALTLGHAHVLRLTCVHTPPGHGLRLTAARALTLTRTLTSGSGLTPWALYAPWLLATKDELEAGKTRNQFCCLPASYLLLPAPPVRQPFGFCFAVFLLYFHFLGNKTH